MLGLGNPGAEYEHTRHNAGFWAVDAFAEYYGFSSFATKFKGLLAEGKIAGEKTYLFKPQTYMNLSGTAAHQLAQFYKIPLSEIFVFYDELDVLPGKIRVKTGGGDGGHNGIKSLDEHLGLDYTRIRIGIGHPGEKHLVHSYVLGKPMAEDRTAVDSVIKAMAKHLPALKKSKETFTTNVALELTPPKPKQEKIIQEKEEQHGV